MAMGRMAKHVGETGGGSGFCPAWGLFGQNVQSMQSAQTACCAWMRHHFEGATPAQPTFLLLQRAFWGFSV